MSIDNGRRVKAVLENYTGEVGLVTYQGKLQCAYMSTKGAPSVDSQATVEGRKYKVASATSGKRITNFITVVLKPFT